MATFTLWIPAKAFALQLLVPTGDSDIEYGRTKWEWKRFYEHFLALKRLSCLINKIFGTIVTLFLLESLLGYASTLDYVFTHLHNPVWQFLAADLIYLSHIHWVIMLTAAVSYQVSYLI